MGSNETITQLTQSCSPMPSFVYNKTFIDEAPVLAVPGFNRAQSAPPVMKESADAKTLHSFQYEDRVMQLQVSKLQERSQLLSGGDSDHSIRNFQEIPTLGSYGHPNICRRPCILFLRGNCGRFGDCGFCHLPHEKKAASFDKQQRDILKSLPSVTFMEMLLPYVRKQVEENEIPGALAILQLLQSEISIWSYGRIATTPRPRPIKRRMRYVLERMSLSGLVSLVCTNVSGKFPKLLSNELKALRETARLVRAAN